MIKPKTAFRIHVESQIGEEYVDDLHIEYPRISKNLFTRAYEDPKKAPNHILIAFAEILDVHA